MAPAVWGMSQHRDPGHSSLNSLPLAANPRLSLSVFSLLCPPFAGVHGKWLQTNFVHWLSVSQAICPWQTETLLLFTAGCYLGLFLALLTEAGEHSLAFRPHTSQGEPSGYWNIPLAFQLPPGGSPTILLTLPLHSLPVSLWWNHFFCLL